MKKYRSVSLPKALVDRIEQIVTRNESIYPSLSAWITAKLEPIVKEEEKG